VFDSYFFRSSDWAIGILDACCENPILVSTLFNLFVTTAGVPKHNNRLCRGAYRSSVGFIDNQIGRVIAALDSYPHLKANTVVVVHSDHGLDLGDHGHWLKRSLHESTLRVPFFIRSPNHNPPSSTPFGGLSIGTPVELVDVYPTLVHLALGLNSSVERGNEVKDGEARPKEVLDGRSLVFLFDEAVKNRIMPSAENHRCSDISGKGGGDGGGIPFHRSRPPIAMYFRCPSKEAGKAAWVDSSVCGSNADFMGFSLTAVASGAELLDHPAALAAAGIDDISFNAKKRPTPMKHASRRKIGRRGRRRRTQSKLPSDDTTISTKRIASSLTHRPKQRFRGSIYNSSTRMIRRDIRSSEKRSKDNDIGVPMSIRNNGARRVLWRYTAWLPWNSRIEKVNWMAVLTQVDKQAGARVYSSESVCTAQFQNQRRVMASTSGFSKNVVDPITLVHINRSIRTGELNSIDQITDKTSNISERSSSSKHRRGKDTLCDIDRVVKLGLPYAEELYTSGWPVTRIRTATAAAAVSSKKPLLSSVSASSLFLSQKDFQTRALGVARTKGSSCGHNGNGWSNQWGMQDVVGFEGPNLASKKSKGHAAHIPLIAAFRSEIFLWLRKREPALEVQGGPRSD